MIEIGKYNELRILRQTSVGLYLGDEQGEAVLLPNKYCPESFEIDDMLYVFVYLDYAERKIATNLTPKIFFHEFALLKVNAVTDVGAFLDWGLEKDLMVPFKEQRQKMEEGRWYIVYLDIDRETNRLFASNKIDNYLQNEELKVKEGEEVELLIMKQTELGFSAIVNNLHKGLLYQNEVFTPLNVGDKVAGFVKKIRDDNKIDLSVQALGYKDAADINTEIILSALNKNNGLLTLSDKSAPEDIYAQLGMSKKAFKKALGSLYKQRKVLILDNGIKLV